MCSYRRDDVDDDAAAPRAAADESLPERLRDVGNSRMTTVCRWLARAICNARVFRGDPQATRACTVQHHARRQTEDWWNVQSTGATQTWRQGEKDNNNRLWEFPFLEPCSSYATLFQCMSAAGTDFFISVALGFNDTSHHINSILASYFKDELLPRRTQFVQKRLSLFGRWTFKTFVRIVSIHNVRLSKNTRDNAKHSYMYSWTVS